MPVHIQMYAIGDRPSRASIGRPHGPVPQVRGAAGATDRPQVVVHESGQPGSGAPPTNSTCSLTGTARRKALLKWTLRRRTTTGSRDVIGHPAPRHSPGDTPAGGYRSVLGQSLPRQRNSRPDNEAQCDCVRPPNPLNPRDLCARMPIIGRERHWVGSTTCLEFEQSVWPCS